MKSSNTLFVWGLIVLGGCDHSLDSVGGFGLGEPTSTVFAFGDQRQVMVVFSDLPELCELLHDTEAPPYTDYWVMSAWTLSGWKLDESLPSAGFASIAEYDQLWDFPDGRGALEFYSLDDPDVLEGRVALEFEGSDVEARFSAHWCDADLFPGLGE